LTSHLPDSQSLLENVILAFKARGATREARPSENEKYKSQTFDSEITKVLHQWKALAALEQCSIILAPLGYRRRLVGGIAVIKVGAATEIGRCLSEK